MSTRQDVDALLAFLRRGYVVEEAEDAWCNSARSTLCTPAEDEPEPRPPHGHPHASAADTAAAAATTAAASPGLKTARPPRKPFPDVRELPRPRKSSWRAALSPLPLSSLSRFAPTRVR